ncbi:MAG: hypothetical protein HQK77_02200 [Desulfobacterales bacterium]|nr:hypothetical protein [Desulfobacterales bacterium]
MLNIDNQPQIIQRLYTLIYKKTIPHAFLFGGIRGIGKYNVAKTFAMAINCFAPKPDDCGDISIDLNKYIETYPCGQCSSCLTSISGNHPDIISIHPEGTSIKIEQIRGVTETISRRPYSAKMRVVVINDCETMNVHASNALLKILEEPPDHTIFILITTQVNTLLPTVLSRCLHMAFMPIPYKQIAEKILTLLPNKATASDDALILSELANGSLEKGIELSNCQGMLDKRKRLIHDVLNLHRKPIGFILAFATTLCEEKQFLEDAFHIIRSCFRDMIIYKFAKNHIINKDLKDVIEHSGSIYTIQSLFAKLNAIHQAEKQLKSNANIKLTLESLCINLAIL